MGPKIKNIQIEVLDLIYSHLAFGMCTMFGMVAAQCNQLFANLAICTGSLSSFALSRVLDNLLHFAASASATICITASARMD